jgi:hypothetical protein
VDISITVKDEIVNIYVPCNKEFISEIKNIGSAKWNSDEKCWTVPEEYIDNVREMMMHIYGYSDISKNETVKVTVKFLEGVAETKDSVKIFGKDVSKATSRDSGARVGENVVLVSGKIESGGSRVYWESQVEEGTIFSLSKVNKNVFDKEKNNPPYKIEILDVKDEVERKSELIAEKEKLLSRISEIDKILENMS